MVFAMTGNSSETNQLVEQAVQGNPQGLGTLLAKHGDRRRRMVANRMDALDREVLALRHFEQLSRAEIAQVLDISEGAAGKRYIRALERLKQVLGRSPGGLKGLLP
jgi:DNA-directed RNA polymerase specialized sigma subunit